MRTESKEGHEAQRGEKGKEGPCVPPITAVFFYRRKKPSQTAAALAANSVVAIPRNPYPEFDGYLTQQQTDTLAEVKTELRLPTRNGMLCKNADATSAKKYAE